MRLTVRTRPGSMGHLDGFRRTDNWKYSTNLRTTQALKQPYLDTNALIFYTLNVIKLIEGEDTRHEQDYWHRPGDHEFRGGGDGGGRTRRHHEPGRQPD